MTTTASALRGVRAQASTNRSPLSGDHSKAAVRDGFARQAHVQASGNESFGKSRCCHQPAAPHAVPSQLVRRPTFPDVVAAANQIGERVSPDVMAQIDRGALSRSQTRERTSILRQRLKSRPHSLIDPRSSNWLGYWDALTATALAFTAFVYRCERSNLPCCLLPIHHLLSLLSVRRRNLGFAGRRLRSHTCPRRRAQPTGSLF